MPLWAGTAAAVAVRPARRGRRGDGAHTGTHYAARGTRLVLLAYASNDHAGVIDVWLGEVELGERGRVQWLPGRHERPPLTSPASGREGRGNGLAGPLGPTHGPRLTGPAGEAARTNSEVGLLPPAYGRFAKRSGQDTSHHVVDSAVTAAG